MTKHDRIIAELVNALAMIERTAKGENSHVQGSAIAPYIAGMANQAQWNVTRQSERNSDGYLVVKA